MKVLVYEIAPGSCAVMIPSKPTGLYPTPESAARAAWNMRNNGTELTTPVIAVTKEATQP